MLRQYKFLACVERLCLNFKICKFKQRYFSTSNVKPKDEKVSENPHDYIDYKKKISKNQFLKMELAENPEFDKAFPFLSDYKKPSTLFPKDEELDYIESLSYEKKTAEPKEESEIYKENFDRFVQGYRTPSGPLKWMGDEEKQKIHTLIDAKFDEMESTGLSREEILYDDGRKGLPLSQDPFFQLLKNKKLVREMLIKPGESFTVEKVVSIALKQNVGLDPSFASFEKDFAEQDKLSKLTQIGFLPKHKRQVNKFREHIDRYYSMNTFPNEDKLREIMNKNTSFHYAPMPKGRFSKKNLRHVNWQDIHWRNTELLTKFLNTAGKIKNRYQNRLKVVQQRRIAKTIKCARNMMLLPSYSFVRPSDKRSLTTLYEDIEEYSKKSINIETGHIYYKTEMPKENKKNEDFVKNYPRDNAISDEKIKVFKDLDFDYMPFTPTTENQEIFEAELFAKKLKENELVKMGKDVNKIKENIKNTDIKLYPILSKYYESRKESETKIDPSKIKESFEKFETKVKQVNHTKFFDLLLTEKTFDHMKLNKLISESNKYKVPENYQDKSLEDAVAMLSDIKKQIGIETIREKDGDEKLKDVVNYKFLNSMKEKEILKNFLSS